MAVEVMLTFELDYRSRFRRQANAAQIFRIYDLSWRIHGRPNCTFGGFGWFWISSDNRDSHVVEMLLKIVAIFFIALVLGLAPYLPLSFFFLLSLMPFHSFAPLSFFILSFTSNFVLSRFQFGTKNIIIFLIKKSINTRIGCLARLLSASRGK
jgi:hypothetical protein